MEEVDRVGDGRGGVAFSKANLSLIVLFYL
jgi:hypothetical protein